jgi:hypothetical protein
MCPRNIRHKLNNDVIPVCVNSFILFLRPGACGMEVGHDVQCWSDGNYTDNVAVGIGGQKLDDR